jgi:hypothetical protein
MVGESDSDSESKSDSPSSEEQNVRNESQTGRVESEFCGQVRLALMKVRLGRVKVKVRLVIVRLGCYMSDWIG